MTPIRAKAAIGISNTYIPVALALVGPCLTGEFLQALLAICFLTFTLWGSHEQVRLAATQPTSLAAKSLCRRRVTEHRLKSSLPACRHHW